MPRPSDILIALRRITRAIDLHSKNLVRKSGLTAPQLMVLRAVEDAGAAMPSAIARNIHLSQATVTNIVDRLVAAGLLTRERSTSDRRVVQISLTAAGRDKLDLAPELLQEGFLREFEQLEDWERTQLTASIQRLAAMMDASHLEAAPILQVGELQPPEKV